MQMQLLERRITALASSLEQRDAQLAETVLLAGLDPAATQATKLVCSPFVLLDTPWGSSDRAGSRSPEEKGQPGKGGGRGLWRLASLTRLM